MAKNYETSIYTREQLNKARTRGQMKGWAQGTVSTVILLAILKFLSWLWIPIVILIGVAGFSGYRYLKKKTDPIEKY
jgi:uncharacterized membrane protein YdbT with pleckstrin-like domain